MTADEEQHSLGMDNVHNLIFILHIIHIILNAFLTVLNLGSLFP